MTRGTIPLNRKKQTESRLAAAGLIFRVGEKSPSLTFPSLTFHLC